ncbi:MAG: Flp pilus assembly protein CpaB [Hyphomicrobiaceae bacterium]|nr:Flp pilus assembly protein CpaB [Hyphomicrobiaceae bacterium]
MKRAQILGISIALVAGAAAFIGMRGLVTPPPAPVVEEKTINSVQVLVAAEAITLGQKVTQANFKWMEWPASAANGTNFITRSSRPNAEIELSGSVARSPLSKFEPITEAKLIKAGKGGVLAAILPAGMRAVSTKITEYTAAGRMILPNDHVDVILTMRKRGSNGNEAHVSTTLFRNIRVLAIGQMIEAKGDQKNADGNVATLELRPDQAEMLARANSAGEISLSLRSVADLNKDKGGIRGPRPERSSGVRMLRYGVPGRAYGVN